jgi:tetratricopeptide (TPR) repeat protein
VADAWMAHLKLSHHPSLPNIQAAGEAFFHLADSRNYEKLHLLSDKLLRRSKDFIPQLVKIDTQLFEEKEYKKKRSVLELIVRLEPREPKYHRFLGQTIEKIEGRGAAGVLEHFREAYNLYPAFAPHLNDMGRCLLARGKPGEFISLVDGLGGGLSNKNINDHTIAIYTKCLAKLGQPEKAPSLRLAQIGKGSREPIFYNDEARYLCGTGDYDAALALIAQAEERGLSNEHIKTMKAKILNAKK